jgi:hypothetical protein
LPPQDPKLQEAQVGWHLGSCTKFREHLACLLQYWVSSVEYTPLFDCWTSLSYKLHPSPAKAAEANIYYYLSKNQLRKSNSPRKWSGSVNYAWYSKIGRSIFHFQIFYEIGEAHTLCIVSLRACVRMAWCRAQLQLFKVDRKNPLQACCLLSQIL